MKSRSSCCLRSKIGRRRSGANDSAMEFMVKRTIDERSDVDTLEQHPTASLETVQAPFEKRCLAKRFSYRYRLLFCLHSVELSLILLSGGLRRLINNLKEKLEEVAPTSSVCLVFRLIDSPSCHTKILFEGLHRP